MSTRRYRPARAAAALALAVSLIHAARAADLPGLTTPASATGAVSILDAQHDGRLDVRVRGQGQDRVHFTLTNRAPDRLQVVLPPGLVAAAATGQGFQSMGLGQPTDQPGRFGGVAAPTDEGAGFRSIPADATPPAIAVGPGQTVEVTLP
jgi:hypothetical protein